MWSRYWDIWASTENVLCVVLQKVHQYIFWKKEERCYKLDCGIKCTIFLSFPTFTVYSFQVWKSPFGGYFYNGICWSVWKEQSSQICSATITVWFSYKNSKNPLWSLSHLHCFPATFLWHILNFRLKMNAIQEWQCIVGHGAQATHRSSTPDGCICHSLTSLLQRILPCLNSHRTFCETSGYSSAPNYKENLI